jgi:hypothetical protein
MAAIDREPGGSTMIRVSIEVRQLIEEEKIIPREPLNDCIKRGILENRRNRESNPAMETRGSLATDLKTITDPSVPSIGTNETAYKSIWDHYHPEDKLQPNDVIHHINGNHNDNRIENLQKMSRHDHSLEHSKIKKKISNVSNNAIVGKDI